MKAPTFNAPAFLQRLDALDKTLTSAGFPETSPWWKNTLRAFFRSGKRSLVLRVGRRGGKSSTLCRVAVAWSLWGSYTVTPGDTGVCAFISVSRDESSQRLTMIEAILGALGVPFSRRGDEVALHDRAVVFRTFTASIAGVSGPTCIFVVGDELAKWKDSDTGSNPARQVVSSVKPTVATQPFAPMFWSSSAFGREDYHAELFDLGDTPAQSVAFAETWIANPTITEQATHDLEPDPDVWAREFACIPSDSLVNDWFAAALDRAFVDQDPPAIIRGMRPIFACDPGFARDNFGWAVLTSRQGEPDRETHRPSRMTWLHASGAWKPDREPSAMARRLRMEVCQVFDPDPDPWTTPIVHSDQFEFHSFRELAGLAGINLVCAAWSGGDAEDSKLGRYRAVRLAMLEGTFRMKADPELRREFKGVRCVISKAGNERIEITRSKAGHGDRVTSIVLAGSIALARSATRPEDLPPPRPGTAAWAEAMHRATREKLVAEHTRRVREQTRRNGVCSIMRDRLDAESHQRWIERQGRR